MQQSLVFPGIVAALWQHVGGFYVGTWRPNSTSEVYALKQQSLAGDVRLCASLLSSLLQLCFAIVQCSAAAMCLQLLSRRVMHAVLDFRGADARCRAAPRQLLPGVYSTNGMQGWWWCHHVAAGPPLHIYSTCPELACSVIWHCRFCWPRP